MKKIDHADKKKAASFDNALKNPNNFLARFISTPVPASIMPISV